MWATTIPLIALLLIALWLKFDLSFAILPVVTLPIWVTLFADQQYSEEAQRRLGIGLLAAGVLFFAAMVIGVLVFLSR